MLDPVEPRASDPSADGPHSRRPRAGPPCAGAPPDVQREAGAGRARETLPAYRASPFVPPPLLRGPHAQMLVARMARAAGRKRYVRTRIETPDGDFLDLDTWDEVPRERERALCLVLHGLEGSSGSGYVRSACRALAARDVRAVALNFRSCSGEPNRVPGSYHAGRTDDVATALHRLAARADGRPLLALGFSLGGNVLLKLLGERGDARPHGLRGAAAVSVPFDLAACAEALERFPGRLYGLRFLRSLRAKVREKAVRFPDRLGPDALEALARIRTVREFDDRFTAPLHGFRDADDYYVRCSARRFAGRIAAPTLVVHSRDDPLVPWRSLPVGELARAPAVRLVPTSHGGHVGFLGRGSGPGGRLWVEGETARFLDACLDAG